MAPDDRPERAPPLQAQVPLEAAAPQETAPPPLEATEASVPLEAAAPQETAPPPLEATEASVPLEAAAPQETAPPPLETPAASAPLEAAAPQETAPPPLETPAASVPPEATAPQETAPPPQETAAASVPPEATAPQETASAPLETPAASAPLEGGEPPHAVDAPRARRCPTCRQTFSGDARFCPFDGMSLVDAPDWNPAADPLLGQVIDGRYEVISVVGEGGMGTVYEVKHTLLGRLFAMKVLRRDIAKDTDLVARFIQEAKAAAAIGHPNIVAVSDFGELDAGGGQPLPYFVMEFLTGKSLAALLRAEKRLAAERVGPLLMQCATALDAAHRAGIVHRDLKPDNIFLLNNGEHEFVKLLDFGVAKIAGGKRLTRIGMVFGTPHYMSPEQAEGKRVDPRTDIYALGVIMYECFVGRVPFEADTYMGVLTQHMFAVPEQIEKVIPDPSKLGALGPVVMRCLAKQPEDRYSSMADLSAGIDAALKKAAALKEQVAEESRRSEAPPLKEQPAPEEQPAVEQPPPKESLSIGAKIAIVIAVIGVPVALAFAFRVWRASRAESLSPPSTLIASSPSTVTAPPPSTLIAPPPSGVLSASPSPDLPTTSSPLETAAPAGADDDTEKLNLTDKPAPSATSKVRHPTIKPRTHQPKNDVVDPWTHQ